MSDTLGMLCDKLNVVSLKMWWAQENLYKIRKQSFEEFDAEFIKSDDGPKLLWEYFKQACDLNIMRNQIIDEIDIYITEMIDAKIKGEDLDNGKFVQRKYKTY
jgi:hypothetical protein